MRTLRKGIRFIAAFLLVNFLFDILYPTVSYALTAGPTSPEATSFEPIDTSDMVNHLSGDLVYSLPLLEVPGPSGGYPLALSYHSGILAQEEASWVGLGWTLNPGAVNRSVSGFPDDVNGANESNRFYWSGGKQFQADIGITMGAVGAGISVGYDTFQGMGVGGYLSYGFSVGVAGVGGRIGASPWGDPYASVGIMVGIGGSATGGISLGGSVGISTNFESVSGYASAGVSYNHKASNGLIKSGSASLLGASLSTAQGGTFSSSAGGVSLSSNGKSGNISTKEFGISLPLPYIELSYKYMRYWIDETTNSETFGSLYFPEGSPDDLLDYDTKSFDTFSLLDPYVDGTIVENNDPDKVMGGTFPDYDLYSVSGQGMSGSIQPYIFKGYLVQQNDGDEDKGVNDHSVISYYMSNHQNSMIQYRFVGDFSNQYRYSSEGFNNDQSENGWPKYIDYLQGVEVHGHDDYSVDSKSPWGHLVGSKHIEYLFNSQISANATKVANVGFIETNSTGFVRPDNDQIGAYIMTNESGVKYHYALPVYCRDEYRYTENIREEHSETEIKKYGSYAYTWLLTAVTGPDYVDRTGDGLSDDDWGYWVEFDYGKWTDNYTWRSPAEGYAIDVDNNLQSVSTGIKQVYYLDAISTKSHTALFVKSERMDAKSTAGYQMGSGLYLSYEAETEQEKENATPYFESKLTDLDIGRYLLSKSSKDVGFEVINGSRSILLELTDKTDEQTTIVTKDHYMASYEVKPVNSLKLEKILLFKKSQLPTVQKETGSEMHRQIDLEWSEIENTYPGDLSESYRVSSIPLQLPDNIIDVNDIEQSHFDASLRVVEFNSTANKYPNDGNEGALAPGTLNSYEYGSSTLHGKLTLQSVDFLGKGGKSLGVPGTKFNYELPNPGTGSNSILQDANGKLYFNDASLDEGDVIKNSSGSKYFAVTRTEDNISYLVQIYGSETTSGTFSWEKTKNFPYSSNHYDIWGLYKTDYENLGRDNFDRLVTEASAAGNDCWSLREIVNPTGSKLEVKYRPDRYSLPVLYDTKSIPVQSVTQDPNTNSVFVKVRDRHYVEDLLTQEEDNIIKLTFAVWHVAKYARSNLLDDRYRHHYPIGDYSLRLRSYNPDYDEEFGLLEFEPPETGYMHELIPRVRIYTSGVQNYFYQRLEAEDKQLMDILVNEGNPADYPDPNLEDYYWESAVGDPAANKDWDLNHIYQPRVVAANIFFEKSSYTPGGGTAVSSVHLYQTDDTGSRTDYDYSMPDDPLISAGFTSYEPGSIHRPEYLREQNDTPNEIKLLYDDYLNKGFSKLMQLSRMIPSPGVLYEHVKIQELIKEGGTWRQVPSYTRYHFRPFDRQMVHVNPHILDYEKDEDVTPYDKYLPTSVDLDLVETGRREIRDYSGSVGQLLSMASYDLNDDLLSKTVYHYLKDEVDAEISGTNIQEERHDTYLGMLSTSADRFAHYDDHIAYAIDDVREVPNDPEHVFVVKRNIQDASTWQERRTFIPIDEMFNDQKIRDAYSELLPQFDYQGVVDESFATGRLIKMGNNKFNLIGLESKRSRYPSIHLGSTTTNYRSGVVTEDRFVEHDFYSGQVISTVHTDASGDMYRTDITPAYWISQYEDMGPIGDGGKNMLMQVAQNTTTLGGYLADGTWDDKALVSSEIQTWNNKWAYPDAQGNIISASQDNHPVWRKDRALTFVGNEFYKSDSDGFLRLKDEFSHLPLSPDYAGWFIEMSDEGWQKTSDITLYDRYSHALEATDINENFVATKMDSKESLVLATVANARYAEFAYSGAEDEPVNGYFGGGVSMTDANRVYSPESAHTGDYYLSVNEIGEYAFSYFVTEDNPYFDREKDYLLSVWVKDWCMDNLQVVVQGDNPEQDIVINGSEASVEGKCVNGWCLFETELSLDEVSGDLWIGCTTSEDASLSVDDFRLHPADATMTSYVYDQQTDELRYVLDNNNFFTEYRYDVMGRLQSSYRETPGHGVVKTNQYGIQYASQN